MLNDNKLVGVTNVSVWSAFSVTKKAYSCNKMFTDGVGKAFIWSGFFVTEKAYGVTNVLYGVWTCPYFCPGLGQASSQKRLDVSKSFPS